jgi:hypothetical protein
MSKEKRRQTIIVGLATGLSLLLVLFVGIKPVEAAGTFTVSNTNESGAGSLRQAITDANAAAGGTINFAPGVTGTIDLLTALPALDSDITINGPGAAMITVQRSTPPTSTFGIFSINSGKTVLLNGLTIKNGIGGIFNTGTLTLSDSIITFCAATNGGGIYNAGTVTVNNSTIRNSGATFGGGIYNTGTVTVNNSVIVNNIANGGSGISNTGTLFVNNSTIDNNMADVGGGIDNLNGMVTITNTTIAGNNSGAGGGGISNRGTGTVTLSNSAIANNISGGCGGICSNGTMIVTNTTIARNSSSSSSGGIGYSGTVTLSNSTVAGNTSKNCGGICGQGTLNLQSTIVAKNGLDVSGNINSQGHNLIGNTTGNSGGDPLQGDILNIDPLFELGPDGKPLLKDNGGATQTIALLSSSPAIDQGKNSSPPQMTDQRGTGFVRLFDNPMVSNAITGDGTDIGAFEVQPLFDLCLRNDGSNASLQINSQTGDYRFCCGGQSYSGRGMVTIRGSILTVQDYGGNRRLLAKMDRSTNLATASLQTPPGSTLCTISGRVNTNNSCSCSMPPAPQ